MVNNPKTVTVLSVWQEYLGRMYPKGTEMSGDQYRQTKLAFYAGFTGCFAFFRDELFAWPEKLLFPKLNELEGELKTQFEEAEKEREVDDERAF